MNRKYVIGKHYHRLVPCPSYDIAEIETWLSDMAEEGLAKRKDALPTKEACDSNSWHIFYVHFTEDLGRIGYRV